MPDTIKNKLLQKQLDGTIVTVQDSLPFKVPYNLLEDSKTSDSPSTVPIEVTPSHGYDGMRKVIVPAIHDGNLRPENIIQGVTILGVEGTATTDNLQQNKTINPPLHTTTFDPNPGFRGMEHVTVNGVLDSEPSLVPENIKKNVSIYGVVGEYDGSPPPYDGTTDMYVGDEEGIKTGDLSVYDEDLIPSNIRNGVTIFGVTGTYGGGSSVLGTKTVNPSTSSTTYNASSDSLDGYSSFTVNAIQTETKSVTPSASQQIITSSAGKYLTSVTVAGDSDLVASNIRKDINIFGVTGTYEGSSVITPISVNPAIDTFPINPSSGSDGISQVTLNGSIPANKIISGTTIFGVNGSYIVSTRSVTDIKTSTTGITINPDGTNAMSSVYIKLDDSMAQYIRKGIYILGVKGTYEYDQVVQIYDHGWKNGYYFDFNVPSELDFDDGNYSLFLSASTSPSGTPEGSYYAYLKYKISVPAGYTKLSVTADVATDGMCDFSFGFSETLDVSSASYSDIFDGSGGTTRTINVSSISLGYISFKIYKYYEYHGIRVSINNIEFQK